jgi:phosphatidylserine decarboxylase
MSVKQGQKYDDPASAKEIPAFVAFHRLNVDEMLQPPSSYSE